MSEFNTSAPRIGIAPDSWGVWNPVDSLQPEADQYLREVAQAGFHITELGPFGYMKTTVQEVRDDLDRNDLVLSAGTVFTGLHRGKSEISVAWARVSEVAELIKPLGAEHLIVIPEMWHRDDQGQVSSSREFSASEWDAMYEGHNEIGRRLWLDYGLRQQFHAHAETQVGDEIEITRLIENTDPDFLNLCLDTGHYAYYFGDSVDLIRKYPSRIGYLHLKQVEPKLMSHVLKNEISFVEGVRQGLMVEPPFGVPGYGPVLEAAQLANPGIFAIIEQDMYPVQDFSLPLQIAIRTKNYIDSCGVPVSYR